ncbi:hypothetical protein F5878DRAFT_631243 [Lentinula raphanica]|uniref:Uncharacterized protein n=1 Tax=Lentinula raphanica TaxID=153919 RepID=A0AA38P0N0_9AGAR|nr:hypothetical protein F5878DRAFT_631243 [Lentinula raphanica]
MRSQIIYTVSVAIALLGAAPIAAIPLPIDEVQPVSTARTDQGTTTKAVTPIWCGLIHEKPEEHWEPLDGNVAKRAQAHYAACFGMDLCIYHVLESSDSGSQSKGTLVVTPRAQLTQNTASPSQIVPRASRRLFDRRFYARLYSVKVFSSRVAPASCRKTLTEKLKKWFSESEAFDSEESMILAAFEFLNSDGALWLEKDIETACTEVSALLHALKATSVTEEVKRLDGERRHKSKPQESRKEYSQPLRQLASKPAGEPWSHGRSNNPPAGTFRSPPQPFDSSSGHQNLHDGALGYYPPAGTFYYPLQPFNPSSGNPPSHEEFPGFYPASTLPHQPFEYSGNHKENQ